MSNLAQRVAAIIPWWPKPVPVHVVPRYHAATRAESRELQRKRDETTEKLRRIVTEQKLVSAVKRAISA